MFCRMYCFTNLTTFVDSKTHTFMIKSTQSFIHLAPGQNTAYKMKKECLVKWFSTFKTF